uniref:Ig-like domain-containing protein n=1 Tax=Sphaeramia orbicularis TaxID=375764 RepID=A0A673B733_9TELE
MLLYAADIIEKKTACSDLMFCVSVSCRLNEMSRRSSVSGLARPDRAIINHTITALSALAGSKVELSCPVLSSGNPKVQWILPDGSKFNSPANSPDGRRRASFSGLLLQNLKLSDAGLYYCVARAGNDIDVLPLRLAHLLLSPGRPVYAHCSARGAPTPTLRWRIPDGTLVRPSQFLRGNLFVLPNGTLHITKVGPKDSGSYECTASNAVGAEKRTVTIQIEVMAEGEKTQAGNEETKRINTENPSPSSSLHKDRTLSIPIYPSNSLNSTKFSPPSPIDRSRSSFSHISFYPHRPTSTNSPPKINKAVTASSTHLTNFSRTKLSSLPSPSTFPANNTRLSTPIVNSTRAVSSSPSDKNRSLYCSTHAHTVSS